MVVGVRLSVSKIKIFDDVERVLRTSRIRVKRIRDVVVQKLEETALLELKRIPPRKFFPLGEFPWTTLLQQKAFFASDGFGAGIPTTRTGAMSAGWEVLGAARTGSFNTVSITVRNKQAGAQFVYGQVNLKDRVAAVQMQQAFHREIGWPIANDIISEATATARKEFRELYFAEFEDETTLKINRRRLR